jgi:PAS domain-containing protein
MPQQPVELILARHMAGGLAVPVLLVDAAGDTLYFNEAAEAILGRRFDEIDALPFGQRTTLIEPRDLEGRPLPTERLPAVIALREGRPAHSVFRMNGLDGSPHVIEATAIPLGSAGGRTLGAMVFLWRAEPTA